jgi:hydrogenase-4 component F
MNEHPCLASSLPAAAVLVPLAAGALVLLGRSLSRAYWEGLTILASAVTLAIGALMAQDVLGGAVLTCWGNELRVDALSALMVVLIGGIGLLISLYSVRYMQQPQVSERLAQSEKQRRSWIFNMLLPWFIGTMVWASVTNNLIVLFVAVEATTLASGLLVAYYWDRRALEAGYKYLLLLTIGLTFALFGCVLVYAGAASTQKLSGGSVLQISEVTKVVHLIAPGTAMVGVAFLMIGFGTKAGVVPFHAWLPDAHAEAPTPISVLLSGVMIKVAAYALARTVNAFFPRWPVLTIFVVALGGLTMAVGILMALAQDDLKRLLAFHSVSQMGYIIAGIGLGTYLGVYGGLFHLVNHTIFKSLLFLCVGAMIFATGGLRRISQVSGLGRKMPITAGCFLIGAFAMGGAPPFNGFMSKLTLFVAFADKELFWAAVIGMVTSLLTLACLVHAGYVVFWGKLRFAGPAPRIEPREVPASMSFAMVVLAGLALLIGVYPHALYPLLDGATRCVLQIMAAA